MKSRPSPTPRTMREDALDVHRVHGRPVVGWTAAKAARQEPARPSEKIDAGRRVRAGIRVRNRAVHDRERHQQAADAGQDLLGHAAPRVAVVGRRGIRSPSVRAEEHRRGVVAEDVEQADQDRRPDDRLADRPARIARLLASGAAASKPTNARRQKTMPCSAGRTPPIPREEHRQRVTRSGADDQQQGDEQEDPDLDDAQRRRRRGSRARSPGRPATRRSGRRSSRAATTAARW